MKLEHDMKLFLKTLVPLILAGMILGAAITWATTPTTTFYISTGVYPGAPQYTIWTEGTGLTQAYYAKRYDGYIPTYSGSTNASYVVNSAISSLTYGGKLYFLESASDYLFTASINITRSGIMLEGESLLVTLKLANNTNKDLVKIPTGSNDVIIEHLTLIGNDAQNTAGNVINCNASTLHVLNSRIWNGSDNNIKLYNPSSYAGLHWITGNSIAFAHNAGVLFWGVYDCFLGFNDIGESGTNNVYVYGSAQIQIFDNQIWSAGINGISLTGSIGVTITKNRIDYNYDHGIAMVNQNITVISDNRIYLNSQNVTNTFSGVYAFDWGAGGRIYGNWHCTIQGNVFYYPGNLQRRAVEAECLSGNARYWSVTGNDVIGNLSKPAMLLTNLTLSVIADNVGYP